MLPYLVKCFFLIFQGISSYISQMNEPRGWTFLRIWYESRGVLGTRNKTSLFLALHGLVYTHPSTAANLPCLPGSPASLPGPNFLRPACPYSGCQLSSFTGSCPMEYIPADYWLILLYYGPMSRKSTT